MQSLLIPILLFLGLAAYLVWQARIEPAPYEVMFEVLPQQGECHSADCQAHERILALEGAINFRDLGGYRTRDGNCLACGKIYRAGALNRLTDGDLELLQALGIRLICDLRSFPEVNAQPDRLPARAAYLHLPVFGRDPIGRWRVLFQRHRLDLLFEQLYSRSIIENGAPVLGDLLRLAADPANLPLVFHCTSGKDRTGLAAALLLHMCGVPRPTIVADYTLTNTSIDRFMAEIREAFAWVPALPGFRLEQLYPLFSARAELIERAFAYIEARYGSVDGYLLGPVRLKDAEIAAIRSNLVI
jgi:protein-tyrosine phosphatase